LSLHEKDQLKKKKKVKYIKHVAEERFLPEETRVE